MKIDAREAGQRGREHSQDFFPCHDVTYPESYPPVDWIRFFKKRILRFYPFDSLIPSRQFPNSLASVAKCHPLDFPILCPRFSSPMSSIAKFRPFGCENLSPLLPIFSHRLSNSIPIDCPIFGLCAPTVTSFRWL
jgi:hypothetical protein